MLIETKMNFSKFLTAWFVELACLKILCLLSSIVEIYYGNNMNFARY